MDDHLPEQFAWLSFAYTVPHGSAVAASGTSRFGGVDGVEPESFHRANHHDREPFGAVCIFISYPTA
ncbi:hypothetical protein [Cohnella lupini]|uniref:hypothetical protein n=1 Tax=Cohnella lupini TaxID=1294267 RepID=UPI0011C047F6|nr:hypothetical protein [Cohnella lupini]